MYPLIPLSALGPEIILLIGGCTVLVLGQAKRPATSRAAPAVTLLTLLLAIAAMVIEGWTRKAMLPAAGSGLYFGPLAVFARNSALVLGVIITFVAWLQPSARERGEFWSMLLFSLLGVLLVGAANDLFVLFLAIELVSLPTYVMVVLSRRNVAALEAGTKYFFLGALATAILAYGFSLLYGVGGSASLLQARVGITRALHEGGTLAHGLAAVGVLAALGGLLFKIGAVPLHFYIADVYQGAASSVAGMLGFVPKFSGFLAIFKIMQLTGHWEMEEPAVYWTLWIIAALSMTIGNALALMQTNIKRMLAYSGVAHSGYMLVGVLIGPDAGRGLLGDGTSAVLFYVVIYGIANLASFGILGLLRVREKPCETLQDVAGLLRRAPGLALLLALAMFTLMGLPPTAGFWGKLSLFGGALAGATAGIGPTWYERWLIVLVIVGVLNTALAAAYYLRVIAAVLLYENDRPAEVVPEEPPYVGAVLCGFLLLVFTFHPALLLEPGRRATASLRGAASIGAGTPIAMSVNHHAAEHSENANTSD